MSTIIKLTKNPPVLSRSSDGKLYIYQNYFTRKQISEKYFRQDLIYNLVCIISNISILNHTFDNNLSLSFFTDLAEFTKEVSEFYPQVSTELTQVEIIQFVADCNQTDNYAKLKENLEKLRRYQPLHKYYRELL